MDAVHPSVFMSPHIAARCRALVRNAAALTVGLLATTFAMAQARLSDQQLKTAYVLNFIRYTDWPEHAFAGPDANVVVCVFGGDPGTPALADVEGKQIRGRTVRIRLVDSADEARTCNVLFVREPEARRFVGTLRALQRLPVLTISEADAFVDVGGMVGLVHINDRLQFEINLGALQQAQLKASLQLLRLARNVIETRTR